MRSYRHSKTHRLIRLPCSGIHYAKSCAGTWVVNVVAQRGGGAMCPLLNLVAGVFSLSRCFRSLSCLVVVVPLIGTHSVVTALLAYSPWVVPPALALCRTTPSACRSPLCFLRSPRRWLRCLLRTCLALACSRASPRQLLPLLPSPPHATRVSASFVRGLPAFPSARPYRWESLPVFY